MLTIGKLATAVGTTAATNHTRPHFSGRRALCHPGLLKAVDDLDKLVVAVCMRLHGMAHVVISSFRLNFP